MRAGLLRAQERLLAYPWSSFGYYLAAPEHRPHWIRVDRLLGEHGLQQDTAAAQQEFELRTRRDASNRVTNRPSKPCAEAAQKTIFRSFLKLFHLAQG